MWILGISAYYHDSAAAIVKDGEIIAAAQEERFSRIKHDHAFPTQAVNYCLSKAGIQAKDLSSVSFYDKPFIKFNRILETYLTYAPRGLPSFLKAMPLWLKQKLWIPDLIAKEIGYNGPVLFPEHHESHAASAFFPSPFTQAAFLTIDGVGEWATSSFGIGQNNRVSILKELHFPHSLGLLYSAFTSYCGFKVNSGEYKLMGLAPYGRSQYVQRIFDNLIDLRDNGSFKMNMKYFSYPFGLRMINNHFERLFGHPGRKPGEPITQHYMDTARSVQEVTEEIMLRMARHVKNQTGQSNLCLAGGVALNCVGNGKLLRSGLFDDIWIQPAAGDAGGALGAALIAWHHHHNQPVRPTPHKKDRQKASLLGPDYSDAQIEQFLNQYQLPHQSLSDAELFDTVSDYIIQGNVVGWFQDRLEFGPRALGNRSIIGDARSATMQRRMNLKIKFRESFRPFAPSVLAEQASNWFAIDHSSPYMLLVADVQKDKRLPVTETDRHRVGLDQLNIKRSVIPAVTHVDYSARIQTVSQTDNPRYYALINRFFVKTGCPVVVNTSFNVRGEPIVASPLDAYLCFMRTDMDVLVLGNYVLVKNEQPETHATLNWETAYEPD
ncbi:MAG: hypothetical protein GF313_08655 [Caldithrix sp.]|nr:hypothetical protein [Caldithrix sp.]